MPGNRNIAADSRMVQSQPNAWRVPVVLVSEVRDFLRDLPADNELVKGTEFNDQQLAKYIIDSIMIYNTTAPIAQELNIRSIDSMYMEQWVLIKDLAVVRALSSVIIKLQRNDFGYTDGTVSKRLNQRWEFYEKSIARLVGGQGSDGIYPRIKEFKVSLNANLGYKISGSPLSYFYGKFSGYVDTIYGQQGM